VSLLIDQVAAYLETQGEGTVGTSIFKVHRPSSPLACVSLHATGGYPPDTYTERERPTVMVFARAGVPADAFRKAYAVFGRLHRRQNLDLGAGLWALTVEASASPAYVGPEETQEGTAHLASLNLAFDLRRPSS